MKHEIDDDCGDGDDDNSGDDGDDGGDEDGDCHDGGGNHVVVNNLSIMKMKNPSTSRVVKTPSLIYHFSSSFSKTYENLKPHE